MSFEYLNNSLYREIDILSVIEEKKSVLHSVCKSERSRGHFFFFYNKLPCQFNQLRDICTDICRRTPFICIYVFIINTFLAYIIKSILRCTYSSVLELITFVDLYTIYIYLSDTSCVCVIFILYTKRFNSLMVKAIAW